MPASPHFSAPPRRIFDDLRRDLAHRHPEDRQGEDRPPAHGVDVRDRVRGGDPAEIGGVVHHRREEVRGGDDAGAVLLLPDGGVVGGLVATSNCLNCAAAGWSASSVRSTSGSSLQPQPPPWARLVRRGLSVIAGAPWRIGCPRRGLGRGGKVVRRRGRDTVPSRGQVEESPA